MGRHLKGTLALLATLALGVAAATAIADEEQTQPPDSDRPVVTEIDQQALDAIDRLTQSRVSSDELPSATVERAESRPLFGINPDLSRRAIANTAQSLYIVPGDEHVCAVLTDGDNAALSCESTEDIADGLSGPATVVLESGDIAVFGLVADGIDEVTVATGVSTTDQVEVEANAYYTVIEAETPLRSVSYEGPSGPVELPIVDPSATP